MPRGGGVGRRRSGPTRRRDPGVSR